MCSRVFVFLIGAVYIFYQVLATDVYIAELVVESNVTLEAEKVLEGLNAGTNFSVNSNGGTHTVTVETSVLIAECLIVGDETSCNCSTNYTWSNEVCYNYNCCRETTCTANVSDIASLCVAKFNVYVNGSVTLSEKKIWESSNTAVLETEFEKLNGFEYLNVTSQSANIAEFEVKVNVKLHTSKLQEIVTGLQNSLGTVLVDTAGMVTIQAPETIVCYESIPELSCTFEEATESSSWFIIRPHQQFQLNDGSVVKLDKCTSEEGLSCTKVKLKKVTGTWAGIYECGFANGSVRHTARAELRVALLPDFINLKVNPPTADCSVQKNVDIAVTATVSDSTEPFKVWWSYNGKNLTSPVTKFNAVYTLNTSVSCVRAKEHYINVTFENTKGQHKTAKVDIPVIYANSKFCKVDNEWPKTPDGDTVILRECPKGRVGYLSRTCKGTTWQAVYPSCVSEQLNAVSNAAENFLTGLGATQKVAKDIFEGLKNSSTLNSDSSDSIADISASVNILNVMASASKTIELQEDVLPDFVNAASNMLNKTWNGVNDSILYSMSSKYLQSVEDLVKNINVNNSNGTESQNLDLKFCTTNDCNLTVFDIDVNVNKTNGTLKTLGVKNLMDKLYNDFKDTERTTLLLSATLQNTNDSSTRIVMGFPTEKLKSTKPHCVFWHTGNNLWSDEGCFFKTNVGNRTVCECNHLTSFSVLMAKGDISTYDLDMITSVGLGVSVGSLLIFLLIESVVWSAVVKTNLSHFRHTALVNIAVFLLLANCSFLASSSPETIGDTWCLVLTVCKHLFYLVMFSWMMCMSVMLVHQLIFVFSPLRKRVFMFLSSIVGYICPILIVGSSYVYCKYTNKKYYNSDTCWLVYDRLLEGSIHAFLLPVGTVILTNLFSMVVVILTLVKSSVPDASKADDKETAKSIIKVVVFLTPVFGVTWIIGFAVLMLPENHSMHTIASYSFTILNSFQGFFILLTGVLAEQKVREEVLKLIMGKSNGKSESMKNLTSTTYTKDK